MKQTDPFFYLFSFLVIDQVNDDDLQLNLFRAFLVMKDSSIDHDLS